MINDGSTMRCTSLGAAKDLMLGLTRSGYFDENQKTQDVMVIAGDSLFHREFDLHNIVTEQHVLSGHSLAVSYRLGPEDDASARGIMEVDSATRRVTKFYEKPADRSVTESRIACPLFYVLKEEVVRLLPGFVDAARMADPDARPSLGKFMQWAINDKDATVSLRSREREREPPRGVGCVPRSVLVARLLVPAFHALSTRSIRCGCRASFVSSGTRGSRSTWTSWSTSSAWTRRRGPGPWAGGS